MKQLNEDEKYLYSVSYHYFFQDNSTLDGVDDNISTFNSFPGIHSFIC